MLTIYKVVNQPVSSNCFIIYDKAVGLDCVIIDPGSKYNDSLYEYINQENLIPKYIILTHEHFDHCWGVNDLVDKYKIPVICSEECSNAIKSHKKNCSIFYNYEDQFEILSDTISIESIDNKLFFLGYEFIFHSTPGHTNASVCIFVENNIFTGDTLILNTKTVTKLRTGSSEKLIKSLELLKYFKGKKVYPGHGDCFIFTDNDINSAIGKSE